MSSDPVAGASGGLAFHELPTADLVMPYGAGPPAHPPAEPDEGPPGRLREEWWRAWLVGSAAGLMAAGVTAGLLFGAGRGPLAGGDGPAADMRSMPSGQMLSIRYPAPSQAGGLVLAGRAGRCAVPGDPGALSRI